MGSGAEEGLEVAGIRTYEDAVAVRNQLAMEYAAASGAHFDLDDLVCFACLSQHKEAVAEATAVVPTPALAVSVRDDLGLDLPVPAPQARLRMRAKAPTSRTFALRMVPVLPLMFPWLHIAAVSYLCLCCRTFHVDGLHMASRPETKRRNIADSVASLLSPWAPMAAAAALLKAEVPRSNLLRIIACAWDWLEKVPCSSLGPSERLMCLALVRLSLKFELADERSDVALELLGSAEEKPELVALECRLMMTLGVPSRA